ncbi:ead/Ea22-like family protein [Edwardsiella tarda]|uniref:ead/Ea22-like family protein n=1 Tax=Edwardsiella tarda TaxID=636 RepID=UPI0034DD61DD
MSQVDKHALRKAAKKATQGEWVAFISHGKYGTYAVHTPKDDRCGDIINWPGFDGRENAAANARYIAAANPNTILALLDELEAAEKRITKLEMKTVLLPKLPVLGSKADWYQGFAAGASGMRNECVNAIRAAGIGVNVRGKEYKE